MDAKEILVEGQQIAACTKYNIPPTLIENWHKSIVVSYFTRVNGLQVSVR